MTQVWGITSLRDGVYLGVALGQLPEIFRHDPFWALPGAALPRSVGKTAFATPTN